jgi:hypothetical protein
LLTSTTIAVGALTALSTVNQAFHKHVSGVVTEVVQGAGVFFDVAGGRCTDGVWLSARHVVEKDGQEVLILFLDCEGIGSLERTATEDMLHCLLAGAVASHTMFKTHYAFNRCCP